MPLVLRSSEIGKRFETSIGLPNHGCHYHDPDPQSAMRADALGTQNPSVVRIGCLIISAA
eukprot:3613052-Pleurochrysis_carterae.AAC.4